jgi:glycine/D-amino acid oxidase-like deaminating enzyme
MDYRTDIEVPELRD